MTIVDQGTGEPIVLVPGIQGRWEWMQPAVQALARRCRVITFSLADEPTCRGHFDQATGFACYVEQIAAALDAAGLERATICGVSYGGLIAAAFAARHPERVSTLVLVSALPPDWAPDARARFYLRAPRLLAPLFCLASLRLYREMAAAADGHRDALVTAGRHAYRVVLHMLSPGRMARRVRLLDGIDWNCLRHLRVPTLVVTGEAHLDRVVPVGLTCQYLALWPHARHATIARTGHLGLITRPAIFAETVAAFVDAAAGQDERRRHIG